MRGLTVLTAISAMIGVAHAQPSPTVRTLIQQGYEVKAYDSSSAKLYLQKGTSLFLCSVTSRGFATSAADVGNAPCAPVS